MTLLPGLEQQVRRSAHRTWPPARRRPWRRVRLILPVAALALAAAALYATLHTPTDVHRSLPPADEREVAPPAPAVVRFEPDPGKIVYVRTRSRNGDGSSSVTEEWHRGRENRRLDRWRNTSEGNRLWEAEQLVDADGLARQINEEGKYREVRRSQSDDAATVIAQRQAGFLADFRARAEKGTLDPDTSLEFAGRPARRYHLPAKTTQEGPPGPDQSYYFDRETGKPLGMTSEWQLNPDQRLTTTQTVEAIELLDPTRENLAKLRRFALERK